VRVTVYVCVSECVCVERAAVVDHPPLPRQYYVRTNLGVCECVCVCV